MSVDIAFPVGTPFETTRQAAERVVAAAHNVNDETNGTAFKHFNTTIGGQTSTGGGPGGGVLPSPPLKPEEYAALMKVAR